MTITIGELGLSLEQDVVSEDNLGSSLRRGAAAGGGNSSSRVASVKIEFDDPKLIFQRICKLLGFAEKHAYPCRYDILFPECKQHICTLLRTY